MRALEGVDLRVAAGEVLAVVGENGAGKSTLMKILAGVLEPDGGELRVAGRRMFFSKVADALEAGVALIHQELNLADNLSVAANVFLGREPQRWGFLAEGWMASEAEEWLERAGLAVDVGLAVGRLTIGKRQQVEIAKALATRARILIFDEPTSSLSEGEAGRLFEVIGELKRQGVAVIYISHRLAEVVDLADRVVVLRDGRKAGELRREEVSEEAMVRMMVGRDLGEFFPRCGGEKGGEGEGQRLGVKGLRTEMWPDAEVTFSVRAGEMVGIAGLVGAGRSEVLRAVFGVDRKLAGEVRVNGRRVEALSARAAIGAGLALVPEDRKVEGLVLELGVEENLCLASAWRDRRAGIFRDEGKERELGGQMTRAMRIKAAAGQRVGQLSGGNQQKVVLGKWMAMEPEVLMLDEPTRGVDVGAKREIYELMEGLAERGKGVVFVSSDLLEVLALSDRVLVMREGRIAGELSRAEATEERVMRLATGVERGMEEIG